VVLLGPFYSQSQTVIAAVLGVCISLATIVFLRRTKTGKSMRMLAQNRDIAKILGVSVTRVSAISLGIGSSYAAIAGALLTPIYLNFPDAQWKPLIAAFVVVIIGGLGSVAGSVVGGLIYGLLETLGSYVVPSGSDILVLVFIIAIILVRPTGLFGVKERL